jgi:FixJ family two-component response regulator
MTIEPVVYVVDDDQAVRDSLRWLIESIGHQVNTYGNAQTFLDDYDPDRPGCIVLDVRMPGMSGLDLQDRLRERSIQIPIIVITGHGDVPMAVRAMKSGALDFVEKPFSDQVLLERIQQALDLDSEYREKYQRIRDIATRHASLTPREREVMDQVVAGHANKVIAYELGVSMKTVEAHRGKVMRKMKARSLSDLVQMAQALKEEQVAV